MSLKSREKLSGNSRFPDSSQEANFFSWDLKCTKLKPAAAPGMGPANEPSPTVSRGYSETAGTDRAPQNLPLHWREQNKPHWETSDVFIKKRSHCQFFLWLAVKVH